MQHWEKILCCGVSPLYLEKLTLSAEIPVMTKIIQDQGVLEVFARADMWIPGRDKEPHLSGTVTELEQRAGSLVKQQYTFPNYLFLNNPHRKESSFLK